MVAPWVEVHGLRLPTREGVAGVREVVEGRAKERNQFLQIGWANESNLDHALDACRWGPYFEEGDLAERLAHVVRAITAGHCYADGSKRTALLVMLVYLDLNDRSLEVTQDQAVEFMKRCADQEGMGIPAIATWIRENSRSKRGLWRQHVAGKP